MSYNPKYKMTFHDTLNLEYVILFCFEDYSGDIIDVLLDENPVKLTVNGDEANMFDTIHTSRVEINLFQEVFNQDLYDDVNNLTDRTCYVKIDSDNFTWRGWLIPDFSKKTFSNLSTVQTLQATDLFSYLKGVPAVGDDGKILYGKYSLISLLENAFKKGMIEDFEYELTCGMTISPAATELDGYNILEQLSIAAESLNDSSGRPPMCYDVIQTILHGIGLTCSLKGEKVIITDLVSEDLNTFKEIGIMYDSDQEILIESSEVITKTRPAKEISAEFPYNRTTGILRDGFFSDWSGDPLQPLTDWLWNSLGFISQEGNGRAENPYGVKLRTHALAFVESYAGLRNSPYRELLSGSSYTIDFNVRFQDWRSWPILDISKLPNPQLQFGMMLVTDDGKQYELWEENGYSKDQSLWVETQKDGSGNYVVDIDTFYTGIGQFHTRRSISLDSTTARQKLSYSIPALPEDGTLYVYISSAFVSPSLADLENNEDRSDLIYYSVILSENLSVNANGVGGEKHYLTNYGGYSSIEDTESFELETGLNESVAGSVYAAIAFRIPIPLIHAGDYAVGDQINFVNLNSLQLNNSDLSLLSLVLQNRMYFKRFSNYQVDLSFRSNTVNFQDLIKLKDEDNDLLPGVYKQLKLEYDFKNCKQSVTIIQMNGQRRPFVTDSAASPTRDQYEFYYQTNDQ